MASVNERWTSWRGCYKNCEAQNHGRPCLSHGCRLQQPCALVLLPAWPTRARPFRPQACSQQPCLRIRPFSWAHPPLDQPDCRDRNHGFRRKARPRSLGAVPLAGSAQLQDGREHGSADKSSWLHPLPPVASPETLGEPYVYPLAPTGGGRPPFWRLRSCLLHLHIPNQRHRSLQHADQVLAHQRPSISVAGAKAPDAQAVAAGQPFPTP